MARNFGERVFKRPAAESIQEAIIRGRHMGVVPDIHQTIESQKPERLNIHQRRYEEISTNPNFLPTKDILDWIRAKRESMYMMGFSDHDQLL